MHLAFEAKLNDREIWRAIEDAALANLHLFELKHICQLQWAVLQLKPKRTSARLDDILYNVVIQRVETGDIS